MTPNTLPERAILDAMRQAANVHVDLLIAESGTYRGVDWSIIPEHVRRPGFMLNVAGRYVATPSTRIAAHELMKEWIDELIQDGKVGDAL